MLNDRELAQQIIDTFLLAQEATPELSAAVVDGNAEKVKTMYGDLSDLISALHKIGAILALNDTIIKLDKFCETLTDSLDRSVAFFPHDIDKAAHKLEFEFFPLLQSAFHHFYFWGCVYPDKESMKYYYEHEKKLFTANSYIEESKKTSVYKYELSISVVSYNKLDYTKQCVESILRTVPKDLNYELILLNHGSTDGTKEYFESLSPTKQLDIKVNGTVGTAIHRIIEGEYGIVFSNDTLAQKNSIENILRCLKSDSKIGWVVPATPNISNLQSIPANYKTMAEMREFADKNNRYDPFRHEQRSRLCNPISGFKSSTALSINWGGHFFTHGKGNFPDDVASMLFRRNGYKNILAKDAYCYHFGSVTIKDEITEKNQVEAYTQGRVNFKRAFGIDPWGTGFCYDYKLAESFECKFDSHVEVLGINCGLGSNSLKIKELYKEHKHNLDVTLTNVTSDESVLLDLCGVSDSAAVIRRLSDAFKDDRDKKYHYIVFEDKFKGVVHNRYDAADLLARLVDGGELYIKCDMEIFKGKFDSITQIGDWVKIMKC